MDRFTLQERFIIAGVLILLIAGTVVNYFRGMRDLEAHSAPLSPAASARPAP